MDAFDLTPAQPAAFEAFRACLTRPEQPVFLLRGYAGTGRMNQWH